MKKNKRAAIELSMNMIVIIIVSIAILSGGMIIFFKTKNSATAFKDKIDDQTRAQIQAMMLKNNYRVTAYPYQISIENGKSGSVGIGITNDQDASQIFNVQTNNIKIRYFANKDSDGSPITLSQGSIQQNINNLQIRPKEQVVKQVLITMPKNVAKGEYVFTMNVMNGTGAGTTYGVINFIVVN